MPDPCDPRVTCAGRLTRMKQLNDLYKIKYLEYANAVGLKGAGRG